MSTTENLPHPAQPPLVPTPAVAPPTATSKPAAADTVRVLHVINGEHYSGAERVQDLLAKCLPEFGYSAGFACLKLDKFHAMRQTREAPLFDVPMRGRFDMRAALKTARIVRAGGYRILHAHTARSILVGGAASALTGVPLIYHAHSPTTRDSTRRWRRRLNGTVERISLRRVRRVIAVSEAMAEHVAVEGFDRRRIAVVPNGVPRRESLPLRAPPRGTWKLGAVALFRPRKGIEVLLEAMARLKREGLPLRLRAVGPFESAEYEADITALAQGLGLGEQVEWTGFVRDATAELQKMDLLVLPSLFGEGLPMVVLEAMAAGVPVVATRVPGVPEAIRHGRDGVLTDAADPNALAGAIAAFVRGEYDWATIRAAAFERQTRLFSDRSMAEGVAAVYNNVLKEESRNNTV